MNQILESLIISSLLAVSESTSIIVQNTTSVASNIDPYWFFSSSAQCAAAIVGLIGAFLTTKLINQKVFLAQLGKDIEENEIKINSIHEEIKPKIEYIQKVDDEDLVTEFLSHIIFEINPDNPQDLDSIYNLAHKNEKYTSINKGILKREYNEEYLKEAKKENERRIDSFLNNLCDSGLIDIHKQDANEMFQEMKKNLPESEFSSFFEKESFIKKRYEEFRKGIIEAEKLLGSYSTRLLSNQIRLPQLSKNDSFRYDKYEQYKDEVTAKYAQISLYKNVLDKQLKLNANKEIPSMKWNFILLFSFSITGVFLPLFMLLQEKDTMNEYSLYIFCIILISWLLVVGNIGIEIWKLLN